MKNYPKVIFGRKENYMNEAEIHCPWEEIKKKEVEHSFFFYSDQNTLKEVKRSRRFYLLTTQLIE